MRKVSKVVGFAYGAFHQQLRLRSTSNSKTISPLTDEDDEAPPLLRRVSSSKPLVATNEMKSKSNPLVSSTWANSREADENSRAFQKVESNDLNKVQIVSSNSDDAIKDAIVSFLTAGSATAVKQTSQTLLAMLLSYQYRVHRALPHLLIDTSVDYNVLLNIPDHFIENPQNGKVKTVWEALFDAFEQHFERHGTYFEISMLATGDNFVGAAGQDTNFGERSASERNISTTTSHSPILKVPYLFNVAIKLFRCLRYYRSNQNPTASVGISTEMGIDDDEFFSRCAGKVLRLLSSGSVSNQPVPGPSLAWSFLIYDVLQETPTLTRAFSEKNSNTNAQISIPIFHYNNNYNNQTSESSVGLGHQIRTDSFPPLSPSQGLCIFMSRLGNPAINHFGLAWEVVSNEPTSASEIEYQEEYEQENFTLHYRLNSLDGSNKETTSNYNSDTNSSRRSKVVDERYPAIGASSRTLSKALTIAHSSSAPPFAEKRMKLLEGLVGSVASLCCKERLIIALSSTLLSGLNTNGFVEENHYDVTVQDDISLTSYSPSMFFVYSEALPGQQAALHLLEEVLLGLRLKYPKRFTELHSLTPISTNYTSLPTPVASFVDLYFVPVASKLLLDSGDAGRQNSATATDLLTRLIFLLYRSLSSIGTEANSLGDFASGALLGAALQSLIKEANQLPSDSQRINPLYNAALDVIPALSPALELYKKLKGGLPIFPTRVVLAQTLLQELRKFVQEDSVETTSSELGSGSVNKMSAIQSAAIMSLRQKKIEGICAAVQFILEDFVHVQTSHSQFAMLLPLISDAISTFEILLSSCAPFSNLKLEEHRAASTVPGFPFFLATAHQIAHDGKESMFDKLAEPILKQLSWLGSQVLPLISNLFRYHQYKQQHPQHSVITHFLSACAALHVTEWAMANNFRQMLDETINYLCRLDSTSPVICATLATRWILAETREQAQNTLRQLCDDGHATALHTAELILAFTHIQMKASEINNRKSGAHLLLQPFWPLQVFTIDLLQLLDACLSMEVKYPNIHGFSVEGLKVLVNCTRLPPSSLNFIQEHSQLDGEPSLQMLQLLQKRVCVNLAKKIFGSETPKWRSVEELVKDCILPSTGRVKRVNVLVELHTINRIMATNSPIQKAKSTARDSVRLTERLQSCVNQLLRVSDVNGFDSVDITFNFTFPAALALPIATHGILFTDNEICLQTTGSLNHRVFASILQPEIPYVRQGQAFATAMTSDCQPATTTPLFTSIQTLINIVKTDISQPSTLFAWYDPSYIEGSNGNNHNVFQPFVLRNSSSQPVLRIQPITCILCDSGVGISVSSPNQVALSPSRKFKLSDALKSQTPILHCTGSVKRK